MPVTIRPSPATVGHNKDDIASPGGGGGAVARALSSNWIKENGSNESPKSWLSMSVVRDWLNSSTSTKTDREHFVIPYNNGLVEGIIRAFQQDLHLVLRPDDVWLAILTQFSLYVTAHAEEYRSKLVNHNGTEGFMVENLRKESYWKIADMIDEFVPKMKEKMASQDVYDWLVPRFSTTKEHDMAISTMIMMATMRPYTVFEMQGGCGFPSVTLLGEVGDWQMILDRLDRFSEFGEEPTAWSKLLKLVLNRMIATFDSPQSPELKKFWMYVCRYSIAMSPNPNTFNGWLTAFMFWGKDGKRTNTVDISANGRNAFKLEDVSFPIIVNDAQVFQTGTVEVLVPITDFYRCVTYTTSIVAGSFGMWVAHEKRAKKGTGSTVQPCSGWLMVEYEREPFERDDGAPTCELSPVVPRD